nr:hypothetical protein Iba_chr03bCG13910 [Ipomoea batatas]
MSQLLTVLPLIHVLSLDWYAIYCRVSESTLDEFTVVTALRQEMHPSPCVEQNVVANDLVRLVQDLSNELNEWREAPPKEYEAVCKDKK